MEESLANLAVSTPSVSGSKEDAVPLIAPEVLRCRRGTIIGHSSLEEAYGEARHAQTRHKLLEVLQGMTQKEKFHCCMQFKEKGNARYAAGEHLEAISCYEQGLMALDFGSSEQQETNVRKQLLIPLLLNLSACLLKLRQHAKARAVCDIALRVDPQCVKALYRRGMAKKELGDLDEAKIDFQHVLALCEKQQQSQQLEQQQPHVTEHEKQTASSTSQRKTHTADESSAASRGFPEARDAGERIVENSSAFEQTMLLVQQCKRQLANVHHQQRQYSAACSRMFKSRVPKRQQQQSQQSETEIATGYKKTPGLFNWNNWQCWMQTYVCKRRSKS